jgi:uncharacterized protein
MTIVGLDLAGVETRPTGFCLLENMKVTTCLIYDDKTILESIKQTNAKIVCIDAPLSLPPGRKSLEEKSNIHLRDCDRELLKRGIRFFPITLGPMRKLTVRGINLKRLLKELDIIALETYPGGAQDVLCISRKQKGLQNLAEGLKKLDIVGINDEMSDHELDAITCAYVGKLFLEGKAVIYGDPCEGIVMPPGEKRKKC